MRSLGIIALLLTGSAAAQTPGFWLTGYAPGTVASSARAVAQDGSIAAGYSTPSGVTPLPGFTWTLPGGRFDFSSPLQSPAYGMSSDGNTVVGMMGEPAPQRAYRRVGSGPLQDLGAGSYQTSYAWGVSGDGSIVTGTLRRTVGTVPFTEAFRWTESGGMQPLGFLPGGVISESNGISRDGSTIVGSSSGRAFVWRQGTGMEPLPAGPGQSTDARGVNADGSVVVGRAALLAARWSGAGRETLGTLPGAISTIALAVSDDGFLVGGSTGGGVLPQTAWVWTPASGILSLTDYLGGFGVSVPAGWRPQELFAISGDGRTFAGQVVSPSGVLQGFVASVPAPSGAVVLLVPALLCLRRGRASR